MSPGVRREVPLLSSSQLLERRGTVLGEACASSLPHQLPADAAAAADFPCYVQEETCPVLLKQGD